MENLFIEFYRGKEEQAFLDAWFNKYNELNEDEIDDLYEKIADAIQQDVKEGKHELGDVYEYQGVKVGKSDFNEFHNLYLFEQE